jgi:predicted N-formylglutamate amidohydrolase
MNETANRLFAPDEPAAITVRNKDGQSPFLIVVDHAGNAIPRALGRHGVARAELERHIAWDIGVAAVSQFLTDELDAALARQNYSRLVIDCNRAPESTVSACMVWIESITISAARLPEEQVARISSTWVALPSSTSASARPRRAARSCTCATASSPEI